MILLSVIIVAWNNKKLILNCLNSIYSISDYNKLKNSIEIIVIDNNSVDDTVESIKNYFPDVKIISNISNVGYAVASNQGMKMSSGKYVLLLGSDTVLKNQCLVKCLDFIENNNMCGAVGCKLLYPDGRLQGNCKKLPTVLNAVFTYSSLNILNHKYDMKWFDYNRILEVEQISTTFLMINKEILKKINYFDEKYRILYNDVDLCKKICLLGYKIFFIHDAEIVHHGSCSTNRADYKIRKIMYEDIFRYFRNNFGILSYVLIPLLCFRLLIVSFLKLFNFN